ncbi:MAG: hypothetical protein ACOC57_01380 [Acidobacteriota bacterium]
MKNKSFEKTITSRGKKFLFRVENSDKARDYAKYEKLRLAVWGEERDHLSGLRNMCGENYFSEGSSLFIGIFTEDGTGSFPLDEKHLVGFSYGYIGVLNKELGFRSPSNLRFYSQYAAVRKDMRNYGLGIELKKFQRETLLKIYGVSWITCTYDPLTAVNAYRNIHVFGMEVMEYRKGFYGDFGGYLNREDIPLDRFYIRWNLRRDFKRQKLNLDSFLSRGCLINPSFEKKVEGKSGNLTLPVVKEYCQKNVDDWALVEIPSDFYKMLRETDVEDEEVKKIPLCWRMVTREAFQRLFRDGFKVIDFIKETGSRRRTFYVLKEAKKD